MSAVSCKRIQLTFGAINQCHKTTQYNVIDYGNRVVLMALGLIGVAGCRGAHLKTAAWEC